MKEPTPPFHFDFLGRCAFHGPQGPARLETAKTSALLVYLALSPAPQSRRRLAELLWGEQSEESANRSLRRALWDLRRKFNLPGLPPLIEADARQVHFVHALCRTDVAEMQSLAQRLERTDPATLLPGDLQAVKTLVPGPFLGDFSAGNAGSFEEWAMLERERLHALGLAMWESLAQGYIAQGDGLSALDAARGLLALDTWREESHRLVMRLLAERGERAAALAQFEQCRRILAEELGSQPGPQTLALCEAIQRDLPAISPLEGAPAELPAQSTPFVGRAAEMAQLGELFSRPDCRLVTVLGPGGMGKTRLALCAGEHLRRDGQAFRGGIFFIPLVGLNSAAEMLSAIGAALGIAAPGSDITLAQISAFLRPRQALLILDNFEQLLAPPDSQAAQQAARLLQEAAGVRLLVTSRERLNLSGEWALELEGLEVPPADTPAEEAQRFSAVQLFLNTARRSRPGFALQAEDLPWIIGLCRQVEGLPLAIELAAGWAHRLTCREIAAEVERGTDLLVSRLRDVPERHRSLQTVFDNSWRLLSAAEQRVFCQLAVFRGGFRRPAAERVAGASLAALSGLADKSLLRRTPDGRYQTHILLAQLALEQLNVSPPLESAARRAHCHYYAALMQECEEFSRRNPQVWHVREYREELENFRAALEWALAQRDLEALDKLARGFYYLSHTLGVYRRGLAIFTQMRAALGWTDAPQPQDELPAWKLAAFQASFQVYLGQAAEAVPVLERCAAHFAPRDLWFESAESNFFAGEGARLSGDFAKARQCLQAAIVFYQKMGQANGEALCLNVLGLTALAEKDIPTAVRLLGESLQIFERTGQLFGQMLVNINLGSLLKGLGDLPGAQKRLEASLPICRDMHHYLGIATCLQRLGEIYQAGGQPEKAQASFDEAALIFRDL